MFQAKKARSSVPQWFWRNRRESKKIRLLIKSVHEKGCWRIKRGVTETAWIHRFSAIGEIGKGKAVPPQTGTASGDGSAASPRGKIGQAWQYP